METNGTLYGREKVLHNVVVVKREEKALEFFPPEKLQACQRELSDKNGSNLSLFLVVLFYGSHCIRLLPIFAALIDSIKIKEIMSF